MNLAVDSRPLSRDIFSARDYTSLQILGLENRPLHRTFDAIRLEDDTTIEIQMAQALWNDGTEITTEHWCKGLSRWLHSQPEVGRYWFNKIRGISHTPTKIKLRLRNRIETWQDLVRSPNWAPLSGFKTSGAFQVSNQPNGWKVQRANGQTGCIYLVNSPEENERLFAIGDIDYTADTAIAFNDISKQCHCRDTGLFGALLFSPELEFTRQSAIERDLTDLRFSETISRHWVSILSTRAQSSLTQALDLKLAFDPFYPNGEISQTIAEHLRQKGHRVCLVEDDYYAPKATADMKFVILRDNGTRGLHLFLALGGLAARRNLQQLWTDILMELERGELNQNDAFTKSRLILPLFRVPSIYRSHQHSANPLLEVFP